MVIEFFEVGSVKPIGEMRIQGLSVQSRGIAISIMSTPLHQRMSADELRRKFRSWSNGYIMSRERQ